MSIRLDGHAMPCETGCLHIACRCAVISAQTFACLKTNLGSVSQPDHMPSPSIDLSAMNKQTIRFSSFAGRHHHPMTSIPLGLVEIMSSCTVISLAINNYPSQAVVSCAAYDHLVRRTCEGS